MQHSILVLSILSLQRCSAFVNPKSHDSLIPCGHSFHVLKSTEDVDDGQRRNSGTLESFSHPSNGVDKDETNIIAFEADITTVLKGARAAEDTTFYPPAFANSKSHLSISYVWDLEMWRKHTNRMRYLRYTLCTFSSRLLKRICPQLIPFVAWSFFYVFVAAKRTNLAKGDVIPLNSLSLVSTFVAFLLTLRSNQGLARLSEGRNLFGRAFIVTRDTSQLLATYVYPKDKKLGLTAARYLSLFAWLLKGGLRDTSDSDIIAIMLPSKSDNTYLDSHRKKPAACISRIRQVVATLASRNELPVAAHQQLETNLNEMNYVLGMCERLRGSPIPPSYTSHASRLLLFYLFFLPIALHGSQVKNLTNVGVTSVVAFAMLGLDEISHLLEQPFQLMPLHELSKRMMMDIADSFVYQTPSSLAEPATKVPNYW